MFRRAFSILFSAIWLVSLPGFLPPARPALAGAAPPAVSLAFPTTIEPDPTVQGMLDQVDINTVYQYDGDLSGEWPVWIGNEWYTLTTRYTYSGTPIQKATQYAGEHLAGLGLNVEYHQWGGPTYPNVIGELPGSENPEDVYIIGGHLDAVSSAPGADDNASGSVATLIAADILSQFRWGCTLRFALWTGEEQGLLGSYAYAQRAHNAGENILGYLNLDMIAWNTPGSAPGIDLYYSPSLPPSLDLANLFADVVQAYDLDLEPQILVDGMGGSDHQSFWDYGYSSILAIEDEADFNPYYHSPQDTLDHLDMPYFTQFVKATLGTFVHLNGCLIAANGSLEGHVRQAGDGAAIPGATVAAQGSRVYPYSVTTDPTGYYTVSLPVDTYTLTASAFGYYPLTLPGVQVLTDTVITQDFELPEAPFYEVSGLVTEAGSGEPVQAEITFGDTPVTVWSDPLTGFYQASLPPGGYLMHARAPGHHPQTRAIVVVDGAQQQDFSLDPLPCLLLVDDDQDAPNVRYHYTYSLADLGSAYDVWDVVSAGNPLIDDLSGYGSVIWFTGQPASNTLTPTDEAAIAAYLDQGGSLLLSSQDYLLEDLQLSDLAQNYLGIAGYTTDVNRTDPVGNTGDPIGGDLGVFSLIRPNGWSVLRTDNASGVQASPFRWNGTGQDNSARFAGPGFKTVFLAWPLEAVSRLDTRTAIIEAILDYLGPCSAPDGWLAGQVTDAGSGEPLANAAITASPGDGLQTVSDAAGAYELALPAGVYTLTAQAASYYSVTVPVTVQAGMTTTQNFALPPLPGQLLVAPQVLSTTLVAGESATQAFRVSNPGAGWLDFAVSVPEAATWLSLNPTQGHLSPGTTTWVTATFTTAGLSTGFYTTTLQLLSNDPQQPQLLLAASLTVLPGCMPTGEVGFFWEPEAPLAGKTITFTGWATGSQPIVYAWDFGDGASGSGNNVAHAYVQSGEYTVYLEASNACSNAVIVQVVHVAEPPLKYYLPMVSGGN